MREPEHMGRHRTIARLALPLLLAGVIVGTAVAPASAAQGAGGAPASILFPVVGHVRYTDDFGAPRGQGRHQGNDILADWRAPAVAVEPGTVTIYTRSASAGCMLYLDGQSGATYLYIHLNNDLTRKNDNKGKCKPGVAYAPGLRTGQKVRAGELLGYVGDSGDANGIAYHLHFELHKNGRKAVSPYRWLRKAKHLLFAVPEARAARAAESAVTLTLSGTIVSASEGETLRQLTLAVSTVELSSGEIFEPDRKVTLSLAPETVLERAGEQVRPGALRPKRRVTVYTAPVEAGLEAQLARPGTLAAARVVVG